jgi:hypothetical protein
MTLQARQLQNHTNAAVTIHQQIAKKFVEAAQKEDVVDQFGLKRPRTVHWRIRYSFFFIRCAQIRIVTFSDEFSSVIDSLSRSENENESEKVMILFCYIYKKF